MTGHPPATESSEDGFTLVEVLVALAVVAIALPALLEIFTVGVAAIRASDSEDEVVRLASSKLAAAGNEIPFSDGHAEGRTERGLAWTLDMRPDEDSRPGAKYIGYRVTATVTWQPTGWQARFGGRPRTVTLATLKIGRRS